MNLLQKASIMLPTAMLIAVGHLSCSKGSQELVLDPPSPQTEQKSELRLGISLPNEVTLRADADADPMQRVRSLRLVFYGATSEAVEYVQDIPVSSRDQLSDIRLMLASADYKLVAIANANDRLSQMTAKGSPLSLLSTAQRLRTDFLSETVDGKLYISMFNDQGPIAISSTQHFSSTGAGASVVRLTVEPTLTRIVVYGEPELANGGKGNAKPRFLTIGTRREGFVMRQLANLSTGQMESQGDQSDRSQRYAKSPNWLEWEQQAPTTSSAIFTLEPERYAEQKWSYVLNRREQLSEPVDNDGIPEIDKVSYYRTENTLPENAFLKSLTPAVIVEYPFIPRELVGQLSSNEGWLRYKGRVYRQTAVVDALGSSGVIDNALVEIVSVLRATGITSESFTKPFSISGVDFHYRGLSYYTVYIKHFPSATSERPYGRYGIVRGNEYRIRLTRIVDSGSPTPPVMRDNMAPIGETRTSAMAVDVTVPTVREQEGNL